MKTYLEIILRVEDLGRAYRQLDEEYRHLRSRWVEAGKVLADSLREQTAFLDNLDQGDEPKNVGEAPPLTPLGTHLRVPLQTQRLTPQRTRIRTQVEKCPGSTLLELQTALEYKNSESLRQTVYAMVQVGILTARGRRPIRYHLPSDGIDNGSPLDDP